MEEENKEEKVVKVKKEPNIKDWTSCDATARMLEKAKKDGVETAFDRAASMKACPIGADSACCKHCSMGPCRLNPKDPYAKVGVCGATIDTIMARNFARMVASGAAAHTDHGMSMLEVFREVVNGNIKDYTIKDPLKLEEVANSIGIETEGREIKDIATDLYEELERTYTQVEGEIPFAQRVPPKPCGKSWKSCIGPTWVWISTMRISPSSAAEPPWAMVGEVPWWPRKFLISFSALPRLSGQK